MDKPIFYRSIGLIEGLYLPSDNDMGIGSLLTSEGLFPSTMNENLIKFFKKDLKKKNSGKKQITKKQRFVCWVQGLPEKPYYQFHLVKRIGVNNKPKKDFNWVLKENTFTTQGFVKEASKGKVLLRVQKNYKPERSDSEIADSISYLQIQGCPGKVRNSQFWLFSSSFQGGMLQCNSAELLAYAKVAKKYAE